MFFYGIRQLKVLMHFRDITQYNSLMTLQQHHKSSKRISEDDVKKALCTKKTQTLEPLIISAKEQGSLPDRLEDRFKLFLKTRSWILHDCVYDNRSKQEDIFTETAYPIIENIL